MNSPSTINYAIDRLVKAKKRNVKICDFNHLIIAVIAGKDVDW